MRLSPDDTRAVVYGLAWMFVTTFITLLLRTMLPPQLQPYVELTSIAIATVLGIGLYRYLITQTSGGRMARIRPSLLIALGVTVLLLSPLIWYTIQATREQRTLYFVIDASQNMGEQLDAVRGEMQLRLRTLPTRLDTGVGVYGGNLGFVTDCTDFTTLLQPTNNQEEIQALTDTIAILGDRGPRGMGGVAGSACDHD